MASMEIFPGVTIDPGVRFGKPCLKGTRMDVAAVVSLLAAGESMETIKDEYGLTQTQILDALGYASNDAETTATAIVGLR